MKKNIINRKHKFSTISLILALLMAFGNFYAPTKAILSNISYAKNYVSTQKHMYNESTSSNLNTPNIVSNLKDYFSESAINFDLTENYKKAYDNLLIEKTQAYLIANDNTNYSNIFGDESMKSQFSKSSSTSAVKYIENLISNSNFTTYSSKSTLNEKLAFFYTNLRNYLLQSDQATITSASQDNITNETTDFYADSTSYKKVKTYLDSEIQKTIATSTYGGEDNNKVAAIIAKDAPSQTSYFYSSSEYPFERNPNPKEFFDFSSENAVFESRAPFYYVYEDNKYKSFSSSSAIPYETTSSGTTFQVYVIDDGTDTSKQTTYEYLGYKTISANDALDQNTYFVVPFTQNSNEDYFKFLYSELETSGKTNLDYNKYVELFYTYLNSNKQSLLRLKYNNEAYKMYVYVDNQTYDARNSNTLKNYKYYKNLKSFDTSTANMNDYELISTTSFANSDYKLDNAGSIKLYFKKEIINYTNTNTEYVKVSGDYVYETEQKLNLNLVKDGSNSKIYVLDESENASENKIYQSLAYTVFTKPTAEYVKIDSSDKNYNENFNLYYKYAEPNDVFAKNLILQTNSQESKNFAIFILSSSTEKDISSICKEKNYIPLSDDALSKGHFALINEGDENFSDEYKLYYKYDTSKTNSGFKNVKETNKIYEYTNGESKYTKFYKTDLSYNINDYVKIINTDENYKEGLDLYYKKTTKTTTEPTTNNTYYYYTTSSTTLDANSYYAISFYVYTSENVKASVEIVDANNIIDTSAFLQTKNISTNCKWVKYYMFIETNLLTSSSITVYMSMGTKDGISDSQLPVNVTGSVLFDDLTITKINETDYNKQTIDDENVFVVNNDTQKVDSEDSNNEVKIINNYSARNKNPDLIEDINLNWNDIFDFDVIDSSYLSNNQTYGGILQKIDINKLDGFSPIGDSALWQSIAGDTARWQYYISSEASKQGKSELLEAYRNAYKNETNSSSDVEISIVNEKDEKASNKSEIKDNDESKANLQIDNTFTNNNKVLKITNNNSTLSLGVISQPFTVAQNECYKLKLWIYSKNKNAQATIKVISALQTAKLDEYGYEFTAGESKIKPYLEEETTIENEYCWIPVEFYIQGNVLRNMNCSLILLADAKSTIYFDNISIEKIKTSNYSSATATTRVYKLSLTNTSYILTKSVTNGYFNDANFEDLSEENKYAPKTAQNWTVSPKYAQDYVTAGIISSKNTNFITTYNQSKAIYDNLSTNLYAINISNNNLDISNSSHLIYSSSISLSANTTYKLSFSYYYSDDAFRGTIYSNLYNSSFAPDNKISTIKTLVEDNTDANTWNKVTYYIQTGTNATTVILELGALESTGTLFIRNCNLTSITDSLDKIVSDNTNKNGNDLTFNNKNKAIINLADKTFSSVKDENDEGIIETKEFKTISKTNEIATTGYTSVTVASFFNEQTETLRTIKANSTTYYIYNDEGTDKLYKFPVYNATTLNSNEEAKTIDGKSFRFENDKVVVGSGITETEYNIVSTTIYKNSYNFENDYNKKSTVISKNDLKNNQSNNVLILSNERNTDHTIIESTDKYSFEKSSYYALKVYAKTSDFDNEEFGLSIKLSATDLDINFDESLINTNNVTNTLHKDLNGFVCYQILIATNSSTAYNDAILTLSLGNEKNTGKGYALISKVELQKFSTLDEFNHYKDIFGSETDNSIIKSYIADEEIKSTSSLNNLNTKNEVTLATFFYIFSSLLLVITIVIAMVAIIIRKKHPTKSSVEQNNFEDDKKEEKVKKTKKSKKVKIVEINDIDKSIE